MRNPKATVVALIMALCAGSAEAAESADQRAAATEAQMTDDERFQLLYGIMPIPFPGASIDPSQFAGIPAIAGYVKGVPRLQIPDLLETDASLGVANPMQLRTDRTTALPSGLALASTFNPQLAYESGKMIGAETRALGYNVLLAGGINLVRDPRNGRNFEYLSEDPLLSGIMAGESIRGIQSNGVISTIKHFALNAQETQRHTLDARIDEAAFRETDLLAFELAIERGQPGSVMCAYNKVNGHYACGHDHLLSEVLKRDWAYPGWVMSDWGAVHDVSYFAAGLDQQSGAQLDKQFWFDQPLRKEVVEGRLSRARLSDAVRRILRSIYAVGADRAANKTTIDFDAHAGVAQAVAGEGIVLLKNDGILPLANTVRSILVVGGFADIGVMSGAGSSQVTPVGGPAALIPIGGPGEMSPFAKQLIVPSSPLKALRAVLPETVSLSFDSGYHPATAAARAAQVDLSIVFVTQWQAEGFDAGSMTLPQGQDLLISAVAKANSNTIVVLETGNPVTMPWLSQVKAVMEAWYPGQRGGEAIAEVLVGRLNPSGRLPVSWPMDEGQLPRPMIPGLGAPERTNVTVEYKEGANIGYRAFALDSERPLFSFGYGLSYTHFAHGPLKLQGGRTPSASFEIRNSGSLAGSDVGQLYLVETPEGPVRRLVGYSKVHLRPDEARSVAMKIDPRLLSRWDSISNRWILAAGLYRFASGRSAADLGMPVSIHLANAEFAP